MVGPDNLTNSTENLTKVLLQGKAAFSLRKQLDYPLEGIAHDTYSVKRKEYDRNYAIFWKNVKLIILGNYIMPQILMKIILETFKRSTIFILNGQLLANDNLLTDKNLIREMWADHFESLDTPSENAHFDNGFLDTVVRAVEGIFISFTNDCTGALSQPFGYEEVAHICTNLKAGMSDVLIDHEHVRFAGPPLWKHLFQLYLKKKITSKCVRRTKTFKLRAQRKFDIRRRL